LPARGFFAFQAAARFLKRQFLGVPERDFIEVPDTLKRLLLRHRPTLVINLLGQLLVPPKLI
jgi:hypothetical protein